MRRHPILFAFLIIFVAAVALGGIVYLITRATGSHPGGDNRVGVVVIEGILTDSQEVIDQIKFFEKDNTIKAIVIRINSPGGGVVPAEEIYDAIRQMRSKKRVVASMGSVAASGGYLVACGAEKIVANPGTITGSISAIMHFANIGDLLNKVGIKSQVIKSGKFKDLGSPVRDMTTEEKALLQTVVDDVYEHFLEVIVRERKMGKDKLREIADGRIFTGRQAKQNALVDELGGLEEAIKIAAKMSGIKGEPQAVYSPEKRGSLWEYLLKGSLASLMSTLWKEEPTPCGLYFVYKPEFSSPR